MAPPSETSRWSFKSRFSIQSFLPARHPPLITGPPRMPPTLPGPRHETIVSDTVSPVHSEYPDLALSTPLPPIKKRSYDGSPLRWVQEQEQVLQESRKRKRAPPPPPLDLDRTHRMYPPNYVDVVIGPGTPPAPPKATKEQAIIEDPFEVAEVEAGHRYPSWKGGRVDIRPGQVIPRGMIPSLSDSDKSSRKSKAPLFTTLATPDNYDSVLHNVLLTPTYLPSPSVQPTPTSPWSYMDEKKNRRQTLLDTISNAGRRASRWVPGKSILRNNHGPYGDIDRSLKAMREREMREMDKFRKGGVRLDVPNSAYSTGSSPAREMSNVYSRKSPGWLGTREAAIGFSGDGKHASHYGDKSWRASKKEDDKKKRNKKLLKIGTIIAVLILVALIVGLCTTLLRKKSSSATSSSSDSSNSTATASSSAAEASATSSKTLSACLDQFTNSASSSPSSYPCSDCVSVLTSTTNDFSQSLVNGNSTGVGSALQFCAMMDIFNKVEDTSDMAKWGEDASPCGWDGVNCDSRGRITTLTLTYPKVPDELPDTLGNVYGLKALHLTGNSSIPTGEFPSSLFKLLNFTTLDLEYTALTGSIDSVSFSDAPGLVTLTLISNANLGTTMPDLSSNTKLLTAVVTGQSLTDANADKLPSSLTYLDLSYNSLTGQIPSFSQLTSLNTLYLQNNEYTSAPSSLPSSLQSISFTSNTDLSGSMPSAVCSSTTLTSCDLRSTSLTAGSGTSSSSQAASSSAVSSSEAASSSAASSSVGSTSVAGSTSSSAVASTSAVSSSVVSSRAASSTVASESSSSAATSSSSALVARAETSSVCGVCQFS
ncbi:hypothetical protein L202_07906 [Cryptococcus amylolentus CBS 6039]|uniref:Leucine-rich repeat-containing N-terminal plant-type domain-containing protein n=1 Tax=Cryptococcus amylolentus CBS 6039 TaxID=1295533 RepID=A0A1E3HAJ1_9TREE|nr:hypothetical protein L202_07906 [Cryptococcus amylolentus CBS 6039]ODN73367.1 hypothetical protein L202_07906 [Cryptococcus amylolentus CBS 6039]